MKTNHTLKPSTLLAGLISGLLGLTSVHAQTIWTNQAGGSWNTAVNWNPNTIPGAGTAVYLTNVIPAYAVTYSAPMSAASIGSLTITNTAATSLSLSAAGFNVTGATTVGNFATLNLNSGAAMNEVGTLAVNGGGTLNVASGAVLTNATLTINTGTYNQTGGSVTNVNMSDVGTAFVVSGGSLVTANWTGSGGSSTGSKCIVTGPGTYVNLGNYYASRTAATANPNEAAPGNNGLIISNGVVVQFTSIVFPGNSSRENSDSQITMYGGNATNSGAFTMYENNNRLSEFYLLGGTFANLGANMTIAGAGGVACPFFLDVRGGTLLAQGVVLVAPAAPSGAGDVGNFFVTNTGSVYLGSGGLTENVTNGQVYSVQLGGASTLGALANWTAGVGTNVINATLVSNGAGTGITIQSADQSGVAHNISWNGVLGGAGGLTKTGGGLLTLSSNNTYTGRTVVSAGELVGLTGGSLSNTASFLIGAGATNGVQLTAANGQWTTTNVLATNASTLDINFNGFGASTTTAPLAVLGNLATTNTWNLFLRGASLSTGTYPLIKYGTQTGTLPAATLGLPNRATGYLSNDVATTKTIYLVVTNNSAEPLTWAATTSTASWDQWETNWVDKFGTPAVYLDPAIDQVVFDDTASAASPLTVNLTNTVTPISVTANLTNDNYTISGAGGVLAGTGYLLKQGSGTLTLNPSTPWTYSGGVTNAGGSLVMGSIVANSSACGTGPVTFNGGTLQMYDAGPGAGSDAGPCTNAWVVPAGQTGTVLCPQRIGYGTSFSSPLTGSGTFTFCPAFSRTIPSGNWTGFTGLLNIAPRPGFTGVVLQWNNAAGIPNAVVNLTNVTFGCYTVQTVPLGALTGSANSYLSPGNAASATYVVGGLNTNCEFDGTISGAVTIRKVGTGAWTLTGANSYTGPTLVSNGTLVVNGTISASPLTNYSGATLTGTGSFGGAVALQAGSTFAIGGLNQYGTNACTGGFLFNGGTNVMDISTTNSDLLTVSGGLNMTAGAIVLNITGTLTNGSYPLINYDSESGSVANLSLTPTSVGSRSYSLVDDNLGHITLQVSAIGNQSLVWSAAGPNSNWNVDGDANWTNSALNSLDVFDNGDSVLFTDAGAANNPVNIAGIVQPSSVVVTGSVAYVFGSTSGAGALAGAASTLTAEGTGSLQLLTVNSYGGGTLIGSGYTVTVGNGGDAASLGLGAITNNGTLIYNQTNSQSLPAVSGTGSLTVNGPSAITLAGGYAYTGGTTIGSGATLQAGTGGATGPLLGSVTDNGTLVMNQSGSLAMTNGITGAGTFTQTGSSTLTLGGANTWQGNTYVKHGRLKMAAANTLPSAATVVGSTGWLVLDGSPTNAGTLDLNGFNETVNALTGVTGTALGVITNTAATGTNVLTIGNTFGSPTTTYAGLITENSGGAKISLVFTGTSTNVLSGNNSYSAGTYVNGGTLDLTTQTSAGSGTITLSNGVTLGLTTSTIYLPNNITIAPDSTATNYSSQLINNYDGQFFAGNANSTNVLTGYISLGAASAEQFGTYTGTVVIPSGSNMRFASTGLAYNGGNSALFDVEGTVYTRNGASAGGIALGALTGAGTLSGAASQALWSTTYRIGGANLNSTFSGTIQNGVDGSVGVTKTGTGWLTLNGTLAYTGNTVVSNGVIALANSAVLDSSPSINLVTANSGVDVSALGSQTLNLGNGSAQTLTGSGFINGSLNENANSFVSIPAGATLTVTNTATLNGTVTLQLNRTNLSANSSEFVCPAVTVGGTLTVTNVGPALQAGDTFQLFSSAVSGSFTATNLPALTGTLYWTNKLAVNGTLKVAGGVALNPTNIITSLSGNVLSLSWPADHLGWALQVQTNNLANGVSANTNDWSRISGSTSVTATNITIDPAQPAEFYRLVYP